jgi:SAM-dependent methyltransferase
MHVKRIIRKAICTLVPTGVVLLLNRILRKLAAAGHHLQFLRQWRIDSKVPHSFDPLIELYWKWGITRNPMSWERGVFGLLAIKAGSRQLDLCCGEGFYTYHFYSGRAGTIIGMDYDRDVISRARRNFPAPNIRFLAGDIRTEMPAGPFDNVSWDAGIEYFTPEEIEGILSAIKTRLAPGGILNGYSVLIEEEPEEVIKAAGRKFVASSREMLGSLLHRFFCNVVILRTQHTDRFGDRINHYFFASDGPLPFSENWPDIQHWVR